MLQRTSAFLFLLISFFVFYIPACGDENFAPAVDGLNSEDIFFVDITKEFENEKDTKDDTEIPKEVLDDLCGEHNSLPMNCCLGDYTGGCFPLECGYVKIEQQCQMVCGGTILYMNFENNVPKWSNIPERYDWGPPPPLPLPIPIPSYPPPLNTPIYCDPW